MDRASLARPMNSASGSGNSGKRITRRSGSQKVLRWENPRGRELSVSSKDYDVFGVEYFVPRLLEGADRKDRLALIAYYKVIALKKQGNGPSRIFQLNKSANEEHYFLEEFSQKAISMAEMYGNEMPDIHTVVRDAISYLDGKKEKKAEFRRKE